MNKRNTIQRSLVLDAVNRLADHATAEEIYRYIAQNHPNIGKATVYRNLRQLAESGDIRPLDVPCGPERFDHLCYPHYHVKCTECGRVFDVEMDYMPDLVQKIKNANGFDFADHDIIFRGVCPECKNKKSSEDS